jgi:hypothetical protein
MTALTSLTFLMTSSGVTGAHGETFSWAPNLSALTALKTLMLRIPDGRQVAEHMAACKDLRQLRNLQLDLPSTLRPLPATRLSLPTCLTALTVLSDERAAPWHQALARLKRLRMLTVRHDILNRDEDVLTALTALSKLVLLTGTRDNKGGGLQVVALQQVQAVGHRLRQLVVVGQPPCRRLEQHLAAVLPPSCKWVFKKEWWPHTLLTPDPVFV